MIEYKVNCVNVKTKPTIERRNRKKNNTSLNRCLIQERKKNYECHSIKQQNQRKKKQKSIIRKYKSWM